MQLMPLVSLLLLLTSSAAGFQAVRDTLAPVADSAVRERELRLTITTGTATRENFVELALLMIRQSRFDDAIVALRGAAAAVARFAEPFDVAMARLQPLRVGGNIRTPIKVTDARPVYPPIAQSARIQGTVMLEALIDDQGNLVNARVVRSIPLLDAAALDAVGKWKYTPADLDGRLVAVVMTVTVNFVLQ
jgi:TonB family protein